MSNTRKYFLNGEGFNYNKKRYIKWIAKKVIGRKINDDECNNILNEHSISYKTIPKIIKDYFEIDYNKNYEYCLECGIGKPYYVN